MRSSLLLYNNSTYSACVPFLNVVKCGWDFWFLMHSTYFDQNWVRISTKTAPFSLPKLQVLQRTTATSTLLLLRNLALINQYANCKRCTQGDNPEEVLTEKLWRNFVYCLPPFTNWKKKKLSTLFIACRRSLSEKKKLNTVVQGTYFHHSPDKIL